MSAIVEYEHVVTDKSNTLVKLDCGHSKLEFINFAPVLGAYIQCDECIAKVAESIRESAE